MKTFKQLLAETPDSIDRDKHEMMLDDDYKIKPPGPYDREETFGGDREYTLKGRSWKSPGSRKRHNIHHWILHHDEDDIAHMHTRGGTTKDKYFIANETAKHEACRWSAPEFYKAILHTGRVKGIQSGEAATEGGKSIWERMAKDPELEVTHHDAETGKQIKLHPHWHWDSNYDQERPTYLRVKLKK